MLWVCYLHESHTECSNCTLLQGSSDLLECLLDGSNITGASRGKIEGSGATGLGMGSLLQDLREAYLERFGGTGQGRDAVARHFDVRLQALAARAQAAESAYSPHK